MAKPLTMQNLSAAFLASETKWPQSVIQDYMNIARNFAILSSQFQALKSGTQATTGAYAPITGWVQERNVGGFNFDATTGEITITATGDYCLNAAVKGSAATGIAIKFQLWDGSAWADVAGAFGEGDSVAQINGFQFTASLSQKVQLVVKDTGGAVDITDNNARFTISRIS